MFTIEPQHTLLQDDSMLYFVHVYWYCPLLCEGDWENNQKEGEGIYKYVSGKVYDGKYK